MKSLSFRKFKAAEFTNKRNEFKMFRFYPSNRRRLEAMEYAEAHQLRYKDDSIVYKDCSEYNNYCFPRKFDKVLSGYIVHVSLKKTFIPIYNK